MDGELTSATVMSLFSQAGPIEWGQANTELKGKRAKAVARFYEKPNTKEAAKSLYDKPLPFCKSIKLITQLVNIIKFKVTINIFSAVQFKIRTAS